MNPRDAPRWECRREHAPQYRAPIRIGGLAVYVLSLGILVWTVFRIWDRWILP